MTLRRTIPVIALLLASPAVIAQSTTERPALPAWEQLDATQRAALIAPVRERWNNADADDRRRMLEHARRWESMTPAERAEARHGLHSWKRLSPARREEARALYSKLRSLPEAERRELRERWTRMSPEERQRWAADNPPPPRERRQR